MNDEPFAENDQQNDTEGNASSSMDASDIVQTEPCRNNPFDAHLLETLHRPTFTPSVFARVVSPTSSYTESPVGRPTASRARSKRARRFRWSIDHIAALNPAQIDENDLSSQEACQRYDDDTEARLQAAIDRFFSQPIIAPSPWKPIDGGGKPCEPVVVQSPSPWKDRECRDHETPGTDLESSFTTANANAKAGIEEDINSSVYLLSNSSDDEDSPSGSQKRLHLSNDDSNKAHRTSMGIDQLLSPEISPIKDLSPVLNQEPSLDESEI